MFLKMGEMTACMCANGSHPIEKQGNSNRGERDCSLSLSRLWKERPPAQMESLASYRKKHTWFIPGNRREGVGVGNRACGGDLLGAFIFSVKYRSQEQQWRCEWRCSYPAFRVPCDSAPWLACVLGTVTVHTHCRASGSRCCLGQDRDRPTN